MMHTRRVTRFRRRRALDKGPSLWQRVASHGGAILVTLACLVLGIGLWWAPIQLTQNYYQKLQDDYGTLHFADGQKVERHWMALPYLAPFVRGDEPAVRQFLHEQPLVVALLDRLESRRLWLRQGDRMVPAPDSKQVQLYRAWITQAEVAQRFQWTPTTEHDPEHEQIPSTVLLGDQWIAIKRWVPGSPLVEEALHRVFGNHAPVRVGVQHQDDAVESKRVPIQPWGDEPAYQVDPGRMNRAPLGFIGTSDALGENWVFQGIPWSGEIKAVRREYFRKQWTTRIVAILVAGTLAGGLWLRRRARQRALLDADRMAALTHSLKTPLAVLKFRCDSIRLGRLEGDQAEAELLRIGEEVDNLTQMIEHGLSAIHGEGAVGPQRTVDAAWLMDVAEDLHPAYEADGRPLELKLCPDAGRAALPSLRPALHTLLENALFHGGGRVTLETWRKGRRFFLRVSDEGPGVEPEQLAAMGKPFMRFRREGKEGFSREGQGLGVSLLCQVAHREGWGLAFASAPGRGFQTTLTLEAES